MTASTFPRRLYLNGEVIEGDPHAANSVVVQDEDGEALARANGYRNAFDVGARKAEANDSTGGNGDGSPPVGSSQEPSGVAPAAADPIDDVDALREQAKAKGVKVHHKAGAETIRKAIAAAQ